MKPGPENNFQAGHRKRLREKFLAGLCTPEEKLELLLMFAIPRRDMRPLSRGLACKFGGMHHVLHAQREDLKAYPGIGESSVILISLFHDMMISDYEDTMKKDEFFNDEKRVHNYCRMLLSSKMVEEMHVFYLGAHKKLIQHEIHSHGTLSWSAVYPREIARVALNLNAKHIIMVHNHPSGEKGFSEEDVEMTTKLKALLAQHDVMLSDHLVVSGDTVYSMNAMALLNQRTDVTDNIAVTPTDNV